MFDDLTLRQPAPTGAISISYQDHVPRITMVDGCEILHQFVTIGHELKQIDTNSSSSSSSSSSNSS